MPSLSKPLIGIDLDGVLVDTDAGWTDYFGHNNCGNLHPNRPITEGWDKWKRLCSKCWDFVLHDHDMITGHPIIEGGPAALAELCQHFRLIALTSRDAIDGLATKRWLEMNGIARYFETVIHFHDKNLILESYHAVAHVDDSPDKLELLALSKSVVPIVFDQPYNQNVTVGYRTHGWKETAAFLIDRFSQNVLAKT